jgi:large subunit ribosomal protein L21e
MAKKSKGFRSGTRKKLRQRTRPPITKFIQEFKKNQKVAILPEPSSHKGMPHPRFKGKMGRIIEKKGKSYIVEITDGNKKKKLIARPEHLKGI